MISSSRILNTRRILLMNSRPLLDTNWMSKSIRIYRGTDRHVRQLQPASLQKCGIDTELATQSASVVDSSLSKSGITSVSRLTKYHERYNPKVVTVGFMVEAIYSIGTEYLLDSELKCVEDFCVSLWCNKDDCYGYWERLFERSTAPLLAELKKKLDEAGISYESFYSTIVDVYFTLDSYENFVWASFTIRPDDVKNIIKHLNFNDHQYQCLKILYSLHDTYGWKI